MKEYVVYILTNYSDSVFYTGVTNNLTKRIWEHKNSTSPDSFTTKYRVYKLVWFELFPTPHEAILIEKRIKGWTRRKKMNLIMEKNPRFMEISLR